MHKHDLDLIAEYAAGTLGDETEARHRVASCQTCAEEYTAQSSVLAELRGMGPARMTEHERARLHRDLWTELRSPADQPAPSPTSPWRWSWAFGAAALVFVAVALVGVMENFGGDDVAETFSEIGAGLNSAADASGDLRADEDAAESGEGGEEALAPDPAAALAERYEDTPYLVIAREVRQEPKANRVLAYDESQLECLAESGLVDHEPISGFETVTDLLVAVPSETAREVAPVAFVDPEVCKVVHIED